MAEPTADTVPLKYLRTLIRAIEEQGYDSAHMVQQLNLSRDMLSSQASRPQSADSCQLLQCCLYLHDIDAAG